MKTITLISTFALLSSFVAFADATVSTNGQSNLIKFGKKMVTREYAKEALARAKYKINGGLVRKAGSAKGYFVLLNAQKSVPCDNLKAALDVIDMRVHIQMKTVQLDSLSIASIPNEMSKVGGNVGVALVDDPTLPALLSAPEEGWSLVNVARLSDADKVKVAMRTRREILRAFALAGGAMYAAQGDFVLQPVRKPSDLDRLIREDYGAAMAHIFPLALPYYGVTPWHQATYKKACEEGWAPQPTNDVLKAIWDKANATPKTPMKIEFDPKKGR